MRPSAKYERLRTHRPSATTDRKDAHQAVRTYTRGDRVVRQVEAGHSPELEAQARVVGARDGDHFGREIDAERAHSGIVEVAGDVPRPAGDIGYRPRLPSG